MASEKLHKREVCIEKHTKEDTGRAGETGELGTNLESLADKVKGEKEGHKKEQERGLHADRVRHKEGVEGKREREGGGVHYVGKVEVSTEGKGSGGEAKGVRDEAETERTREEKERRGKVEEDNARTMENKKDAKPRERAKTEDRTKQVKGGGEGQGRGRERAEIEGGIKEVKGKLGGSGGGEGQRRERQREEEEERSRLEEISKYRAQAKQNTMDAIAGAQERYERAKQGASEALNNAAQTAQEKSKQAKDGTVEKGQQGYAAAKDKASDSKDKAKVAGWNAANYSAEKTVEGTRAAANVVRDAAGYGGQKASELAAKSVDTAKGLAAAAGDTAKEYTARKKEEAHGDLEAKKATQNQENKERASAKTNIENIQRGERQELDQGGKQQPGEFGQPVVLVPQIETKPQKQSGAVEQTVVLVPQTNTKPQSNTAESFQGVQERNNQRNQGGSLETKSQHAQKMNPTGERLQQGQEEAQRELEAKRAAQNQEKKERPSVKTTTENIQRGETQEQDQGGKQQPVVLVPKIETRPHKQPGAADQTVVLVPQMDTKPQSNTSESFHRVQERNNERNQGGPLETKSQHAQKRNPTGESLQQGQEKAQRELEAMRATQNQENKERPSTKTTTESIQREERQEQDQGRKHQPSAIGQTAVQAPQRATKPHDESNTVDSFQDVQERGKERNQGGSLETKSQHAQKMNPTVESLQQDQEAKGSYEFTTISNTVIDATEIVQKPHENIAGKGFQGEQEQMMEKPLDDNTTEGGSEVLGAVSETVVEIGENMMKPAEKVQLQGEEGKGGGVFSAIGETIAEIAQTTKVLVVGEGDTESRQNIGSEYKHE